MDEVYSSRPDLMDAEAPSWMQSSNSSQMEATLSRMDGKRPGSQSPLLMTSYRLKPYHKDGPHNELNFGHWSRCCDTQRENG
jgi:hypothetical protein